MRNTNESSLKEVIDQLLDNYKLKDKLNEIKIREVWDEAMGVAIRNRTTEIRIKKDTLFITVSSAPLRDELQFQKGRIIDIMNKALGAPVLQNVVIN